MFCINCGKGILPESKFCSFCGSSNDLATVSINPDENQKSPFNWPKDISPKNPTSFNSDFNLNSKDKRIVFYVSTLIIVLVGFVFIARNNDNVSTSESNVPNTVLNYEFDVNPNQQTPAIANTSCKSWAEPIWSTEGEEVLKCEGDFWVVVPDLTTDLLERLNQTGDVKWIEDTLVPISVPDFKKRAYRTFIGDDCLVTELVYEGSLDKLWDTWGHPILIWEFKDYKSGLFIHLHVPDRPNATNSSCMKSASDAFNLNFINN